MVYLPRYVAAPDAAASDDAIGAIGRRIQSYLQRCASQTRAVFACEGEPPPAPPTSAVTVDMIVRTLLHRDFNYQAKGRIAHLLPHVAERVANAVARAAPLPLYLLYHGGYRAASGADHADLTFTPDGTELLLLHQITRT